MAKSSLIGHIERYLQEEWRKRDEYYRKKREESGEHRFFPYLIGKCARQAVYILMGFPQPEPTPRLLRIFENGTSMHERYQRWVEACGISLQTEYRLKNDELMTQGRCDNICIIDGVLRIVEFKTANKEDFARMCQTKQPLPEHMDQDQLYMHLSGIPNGIILVECIVTDRDWRIKVPPSEPERGFFSSDFVLEFHTQYNPNHVCVDGYPLLEKIKTINACVQQHRLPERPFAINSRQCRWCPFRERCWHKDPDSGPPAL